MAMTFSDPPSCGHRRAEPPSRSPSAQSTAPHPSGQLRPWPNCSSIRLPSIRFLPPPRMLRRHIGAKRRDEDQDANRRSMPGLTSGMMIVPQHAEGRGVKIIARFDEAEIELLHTCVKWQHHQRQIDIDHADKDRAVRVTASAAVDRSGPGPTGCVLIMPSLRMICRIAKVRINRLVQNGMVIRNSQSSRVFGGRVAMK